MTSADSQGLWSQTYDVSTFLVSRQGRLSLYGLLNLLQDAAIVHAYHLGHGMRATLERSALWVLTRQKVSMTRWPQWNERVVVRTWIRPASGAFAVRDFEIRAAADESLLGEASTSWLLLNASTHKPIRENISALGFPSVDSRRCSFDAEKLAVRSSEPSTADSALSVLARFEVRNSDIDLNQHVNNTRYSQWILDAIPISLHSERILDSYSVNFLAETHLGDVIEIHGDRTGYYHGQRVSDQKIVFTAMLATHSVWDSVSV